MKGPRRAVHCLATLLWAATLSAGALGGQVAQNPYVSESAHAVQSAAAPSAFTGRSKAAAAASLNCSDASACLAMCPAHSFLEPDGSGTRPSGKHIAQQARVQTQLFAPKVGVTRHLRRSVAGCGHSRCRVY